MPHRNPPIIWIHDRIMRLFQVFKPRVFSLVDRVKLRNDFMA